MIHNMNTSTSAKRRKVGEAISRARLAKGIQTAEEASEIYLRMCPPGWERGGGVSNWKNYEAGKGEGAGTTNQFRTLSMMAKVVGLDPAKVFHDYGFDPNRVPREIDKVEDFENLPADEDPDASPFFRLFGAPPNATRAERKRALLAARDLLDEQLRRL